MALESSCLADQFDHPDKDNCPNKSDDKAVEVETTNATFSKGAHDITSNNSSDDTDNNIEDNALLAVSTHNHGCYPPNECSKNDPKKNAHMFVVKK